MTFPEAALPETGSFDADIERRYLATALTDQTILTTYPLPPDAFFFDKHAKALKAMVEIDAERAELGSVALRLRLEAGGSTGAWEDIASLGDPLLTPRDVKAAQERLLGLMEARNRERVYREAAKFLGQHRPDKAEALLGDLSAEAASGSVSSLDEVSARVWERLNAPQNHGPLLSTGIACVDQAIGGVAAGSLIVVGADTGVGKSSLLLSMAINMARQGTKVGIVSCEDHEDVWGDRIMGARAGVQGRKIRMRTLNEIEWRRLAEVASEPSNLPVYFSPQIGGNDFDVCSAMSALVRMGCRFLMIDYLQTINTSARAENRREAIRQIASSLKAHATRLGVPLVLASQLSRPSADDAHREPSKHHLKESGDIENMAELILLLWRDRSQNLMAKVAKSKWGGDNFAFALHRDSAGTLVES